jgi:proteic killer suppression protein
VIQSFADVTTADLFHGKSTPAARAIPKELWRVVHRKLDMVNAAAAIQDLRVPPGNRLTAMKGRGAGFEIRVNDQYRIYFRFEDGNAFDVRCGDDH